MDRLEALEARVAKLEALTIPPFLATQVPLPPAEEALWDRWRQGRGEPLGVVTAREGTAPVLPALTGGDIITIPGLPGQWVVATGALPRVQTISQTGRAWHRMMRQPVRIGRRVSRRSLPKCPR